jgi:hypothetical protein
MAAASFDDVLTIAGFGVCLSLAVDGERESAQGSPIAWLVLRAPVEIACGVSVGLLVGLGFTRCMKTIAEHSLEAALPEKEAAHQAATAVLGFACLSVIGGKHLGFTGGGALAAVTLGCAAARGWPPSTRVIVQKRLNKVWRYFQPALFGLLGAGVELRSLSADELGLLAAGLAIIALGGLVRISVVRLALLRSGLSRTEAWFICVAWLPKATVQAALGGTALDLVGGLGDGARARAELLLSMSVLAILVTAPIGAIGIARMGPKWLARERRRSCDGAANSVASVVRGANASLSSTSTSASAARASALNGGSGSPAGASELTGVCGSARLVGTDEGAGAPTVV